MFTSQQIFLTKYNLNETGKSDFYYFGRNGSSNALSKALIGSKLTWKQKQNNIILLIVSVQKKNHSLQKSAY